MSYREWKAGLISDDQYSMEYMLDEMRAASLNRVEDQDDEEDEEDCEGE